jgi:hypothetical protein
MVPGNLMIHLITVHLITLQGYISSKDLKRRSCHWILYIQLLLHLFATYFISLSQMIHLMS